MQKLELLSGQATGSLIQAPTNRHLGPLGRTVVAVDCSTVRFPSYRCIVCHARALHTGSEVEFVFSREFPPPTQEIPTSYRDISLSQSKRTPDCVCWFTLDHTCSLSGYRVLDPPEPATTGRSDGSIVAGADPCGRRDDLRLVSCPVFAPDSILSC